MGYRTRLGNAKCSLTSCFSPSLVTLHELIHLTTLKSPNSPCGILPDLGREGSSELCPSPREQQNWMSQQRMSLWGWSDRPRFRFADSRSPSEGCGEKHLASTRATGLESQYWLLKSLSPKSVFLREKTGGGSPHIPLGTGLLSDNFYFRASLLQFALSLSWQRATYFEIFCNTSEVLEV